MKTLAAVAIFSAFLFSCSTATAQSYPCRTNGDCDFWVAPQPPGDDDHPFFKRGGNGISASDIKVGDIIIATTEVHVRLDTPPAAWKGSPFQLYEGQTVKVLQTVLVSGGGGQLWLRITQQQNTSQAAPGGYPPQSQQAAVTEGSCFQLPDTDVPSPVLVISPPVKDTPPSKADLLRLLVGRDLFCDEHGLIVHRNNNGTFNGGDTLAREG